MEETSLSLHQIFLTAFFLFLLAILFLKGISILSHWKAEPYCFNSAVHIAYIYLRTYKLNGIKLNKVLYTQLLLNILWTASSLTF